MIFNALAILSLSAAALANPMVKAPFNMTYNAGDEMTIKWEGAKTGKVNIDLVDTFSDIMKHPLNIASGVPSENGSYAWKVPTELKSATGYRVRVWGTETPEKESKEGQSNMFTVLNVVPNAINTFIVTSPSKAKPCQAGQNCVITWDYPDNSNYPANVNIALYRVGNPSPFQFIGTADTSKKSYTWAVPNDASLVTSDMYVSVSGEGNPPAGPGFGNSMGGNSNAFAIDASSASPQTGHQQGMDGVKGDGMKKDDGMRKDDGMKDEENDKKEKKFEKKKLSEPRIPAAPKVTGASRKEKNAATNLSAGEIAKVAALIALVPLAMLL